MTRAPIVLTLLTLAGLIAGPAGAAPCARPDALGTARVLGVDSTSQPVGRKHFPRTLPLAPKEVVLTFDDGPWPGPTTRVLEALAHECARATFFMLGRNAAAHPALARRILDVGHTVGYHTYAHPILSRMTPAKAENEIDRGIAAVNLAVYGTAERTPRVPFFRFPGFASTPNLLARLKERRMVVFGADVWASDWNPMTPAQELQLVRGRLKAAGGGIVLFHDTKAQTAAMLPAFLRALKADGYRVVHIVPADM